jgi:hypothetical protein
VRVQLAWVPACNDILCVTLCVNERNIIGNVATKECMHTCAPCTLCMKNSEKYERYQNLTLEEKGVIFRYKRTHQFGFICYPCMKRIARFIQIPKSKACPRWLQKQFNKAGQECVISHLVMGRFTSILDYGHTI